MMKKSVLAIIGCMSIGLSCSNQPSIVGKWTEPVPGMPQLQQGFILEEDGTASSVGMASLVYEHWKREQEQLILTGKSIGNRQTIAFSDTLQIELLSQDSLLVRKGQLTFRYGRGPVNE